MPEACARTWGLRAIDLFAGIPDEEIKRLAGTLGTERHRAGAQIAGPESSTETVYIVLEGQVRLYHRRPDGHEVTATTIGRGHIFGVSALFGPGSGTSGLRAEAMTDVVLCLARGRDFRELLERYPDVMMRVMQIVVERLIEVEARLDRLTSGDARARLVDLLHELAQTTGEATNREWRITSLPTHAALARQIGVNRETVSRLLSRLEADGLIRREKKGIVVPDLDRLTRS